MTRRFRAPVVLALASLSLGACTETKELGIRVSFNDDADKARSVLVEVTVHEGSCAAPGAQVYSADVLLPSGTTSAGPMDIDSGPHAFSARAIAADCSIVGEACVDRELPTDEAAIRIPIAGGASGSACTVGEECLGNGTCRRMSIPDASVMCMGDGDCAGGTCHGGECCFGCWDGTTCQSGRTAVACGAGGDACEPCGVGNSCIGSLCVARSMDSTFDVSPNAVFFRHRSGVYYASYEPAGTDFAHTGPITTVPPATAGLGGYTGSLRFADVSGTQYAACGLTEDEGELYCWGTNAYGLLAVNDGSPTRVETEPLRTNTPLDRFIDIDGGDGHMCAIRTDGRLLCWGSNMQGQLGLGTMAGTQAVPQPVVDPSTWSQVSALGNFTCAIRSDGGLFCWGENDTGQLGVGGMAGTGTPTRVGSATDWIQVSAGVKHGCGIRGAGTSGTLWCWGRGMSGELGLGTDVSHDTPQQVGTLDTWSQVTAGQFHTCALNGDTALCWGANLWGSLGDGGTMSSPSPVGVTGVTSAWESIAASWHFTCGVASDTAYCWGQSTAAGFTDMPDAVPAPLELGLFPVP